MSMPIESHSTDEPVWSRLFANADQFNHWYQKHSRRRFSKAETAVTFTPLSPTGASQNSSHLSALCEQVKNSGFACYEWTEAPNSVPEALGQLLQSIGLSDSDKGVIREVAELSLLQDLSNTPQGRFPAYQSGAMNWHTDGYYNDQEQTIRSFTLHCLHPANEGGNLLLMDTNLLLLALLDDAPESVRLLSHPQAMTLPKNRDELGHHRPDRTVPIIFKHSDQSIGMRFTTRSQNIRWRCEQTQLSAEKAHSLILSNRQWHTKVKLDAGQGIVTRNILHARDAFTDHESYPKRQMLRGRFRQVPHFTARPADQIESTSPVTDAPSHSVKYRE